MYHADDDRAEEHKDETDCDEFDFADHGPSCLGERGESVHESRAKRKAQKKFRGATKFQVQCTKPAPNLNFL